MNLCKLIIALIINECIEALSGRVRLRFQKSTSGFYIQGDIEQLSISEDPQQAERQCHFQTGDHVS